VWAASAAGRASGGRGAQGRPAAARAADSPPAAGRVGGVRADDGTHIGCQASNVVFEDGNLTRKEATIIIQSVRALDAIKRLRLYGKFTLIIPICCVELRKSVWQRRIVFWGGQKRIVVESQINDRCSYILVEKVKTRYWNKNHDKAFN
jgi:hypothetical protein